MKLRNVTPGESSTVHGTAFASCSCGWSCTREMEVDVRAAASVHALSHKVRHQPVTLPLIPIAPVRAWSSGEAR